MGYNPTGFNDSCSRDIWRYGVFTPYTRGAKDLILLLSFGTSIDGWGTPFLPTKHVKMKQTLVQLSQQYATTLGKQLKLGPRASLLPALELGRQAVVLGLETLDLARIHEQAMVELQLSTTKNAFTKLAGIFFIEANTAIEETHSAARKAKVELSRMMASLGERTAELAASNRHLQRGVARRKAMEADSAKRGRRHQKSLEESLQLQTRLRHLTHQVLSAQEDERKKISHELQDEIAQTLLGINVRLLSLKQEARKNTNGFKNTIANTQRLVAKSARSVRQVGRKIGGL
jgi:signal transduction histidine kinase